MFKQRLFTQILVVGVIGIFCLSTNPTLLVPNTVFAEASVQPAIQVSGQYCPFTAQEIQSLHTVYNSDNNETSAGNQQRANRLRRRDLCTEPVQDQPIIAQ